jgi:hypothetical protein
VLLTGSPEVPVIINHSGRAIIGFDLTTYEAHGGKGPGAGLVLVYLRSAAIMDGAQYQPPLSGGRLPIVKAVLDKAYSRFLGGVRKSLGHDIDFANQKDREAIGNALVKHIRMVDVMSRAIDRPAR